MDYYYDDGSGALLAVYGVAIVLGLLFAVAAYVVSSFFLMKLFAKAGVANPAVAWIPFYNYLVFSKLGDLSPWVTLIAFGASIVLSGIPVLGSIISLLPLAAFVLAAYRVNLKLQKDAVGFTIFAALLSIIWLGVVALGSSRWNTASAPLEGIAPPPAPPWASQSFFMDTTTWGGVPFQGYAVTPPAPPAAPPAPPAA